MIALKHERIAAELATEIRTGRLAIGNQLPGETALAQRFSVSRNTVRAALRELSKEGLIATRSGKGSFVSYDGRSLDARAGWARAFHEQGVEVVTQVLRLETIEDAALASALGLGRVEFVAVDRVRRLAEGHVISLERSRVPVTDRTADVPARGLTRGSLTQTLRECGLIGTRGQQTFDARELTAEEAAVIGREKTDWFLHSVRITWSVDDDLVEHVDSLLDPAHFEFRLEFGDD